MTFGIHSEAKNNSNLQHAANNASRTEQTRGKVGRLIATFCVRTLERQTVSMNFERRLFFDVNQT